MTRLNIGSMIVPAVVFSAVAVGKAAPATAPAENPKIVTLTVAPAPAPVPAFTYRLRAHYMDQTPGNAALQYLSALELYHSANKPEDADKIVEWLDLPAEKLPADAVRAMLNQHLATLTQTHLAARYEHCDWEYPLRSQGMQTLLPALAPFRALARLVALKVRFEISQNQLDEAVGDLQTGYAMARHACDSPVLIGDLVGYSIAGTMNRQVQCWVQAPKAGNLYWALADLPAPFKDPRLLLGGEESWIYVSFPALREAKPRLSAAEWTRMAEDIQKLTQSEGPQAHDWKDKLTVTAAMVKFYPQAKKDLIAAGHSPEEVEAMPPAQAVITAGHEAYVRQRDDIFKWLTIPYWQARPGLVEAEKRMTEAEAGNKYYPFSGLLPALTRAFYNTTRVERELAALRCVEAIRLFAAMNGGQLPASLDQIKVVPLPMDPITGKDFVYQVESGKATLIAVRPEGESPKEETRYVITLRKP